MGAAGGWGRPCARRVASRKGHRFFRPREAGAQQQAACQRRRCRRRRAAARPVSLAARSSPVTFLCHFRLKQWLCWVLGVGRGGGEEGGGVEASGGYMQSEGDEVGRDEQERSARRDAEGRSWLKRGEPGVPEGPTGRTRRPVFAAAQEVGETRGGVSRRARSARDGQRSTDLELEEVGPRALEVPAIALEALDGKGHDQARPLGELLDEGLLLRVRLSGRVGQEAVSRGLGEEARG